MFEKSSHYDQNPLENNRVIDPKMGAIGAAIMGGVVYYINHDAGFDAASVATLKQATYTFFAGGITTRFCENLSIYFENKKVSKVMSILVPSTIAIGLTYLLHNLKGTPEPMNSTIPSMVISPPGCAWWGHRKRKQLERIMAE
ncbi:hypothetical protein K8R33_02225 [archaeon]|nr:hypothetical protein [archaeon]